MQRQHPGFVFSVWRPVGVLSAAACLCVAPLAAGQASPSVSATTPAAAGAAAQALEYTLGPGDAIKIQVFQNTDLTLETRVSEAGTITYPLIGAVQIGGLSIAKAEARIAQLLEEGGFIVKPQVTVLVTQIRGNEVSALGMFNHPGRFPLETTHMKLSDVIALAGGIMPTGSDSVFLVGVRAGRPFHREIDVPSMLSVPGGGDDPLVQAGDVVYVHRAPLVYIYGEVQRPGSFRLERNMTVMMALANGGGLTPRGTQRHVRLHRVAADGQIQEIEPKLDDRLQPDDVVFVRESLF
jgi:polysaccharide export outer membrane protein